MCSRGTPEPSPGCRRLEVWYGTFIAVADGPCLQSAPMSRDVIESLARALHAAYEGDPFHSLRGNLQAVTPREWAAKPENYSEEILGRSLSIGDLVRHAAGSLWVWGNWAFGDAQRTWTDNVPPGSDMDSLLGWLDDAHREFVAGLTALADDSDLAVERPAPALDTATREQMVSVMISHMVYHSGELNRQRSLMLGAEGWSLAD